jgi:hypothetical protein
MPTRQELRISSWARRIADQMSDRTAESIETRSNIEGTTPSIQKILSGEDYPEKGQFVKFNFVFLVVVVNLGCRRVCDA